MKRALENLRVMELGQVMAGPFCALQLCDMGADVIKVEPPEGDPTRLMGTRAGTDSTGFAALNRGKRSVVLDLKTPEGRTAAVKLAERSDVLIENFRPGVMRGFGLDYATLSDLNPRLIYASISGYGQTGPDAAKGGFDLVAQGASGVMSVTGEPGGPPVKVGVPITDLGAGLFALAAILAALNQRHHTGAGQYIDTSLLEAGLALSVWESDEFLSRGATPEPLGSAHRFLAPYQAIRCADGYITIGAGTNRLFAELASVLGHPEWTSTPEFGDTAARKQHTAALIAQIEAVTTTKAKEHWLEQFTTRRIPCGPINTYAEVFGDPQVQARQMVVETDHPTLGRNRAVAFPVKMSGASSSAARRAPMLGEHTDEVLRELGMGSV